MVVAAPALQRGRLPAPAANVSLRAELAADALAAAVLNGAAKKTSSNSTKDGDCGCHADSEAAIVLRRYRPAASGSFTIWDALGELPDEAVSGGIS